MKVEGNKLSSIFVLPLFLSFGLVILFTSSRRYPFTILTHAYTLFHHVIQHQQQQKQQQQTQPQDQQSSEYSGWTPEQIQQYYAQQYAGYPGYDYSQYQQDGSGAGDGKDKKSVCRYHLMWHMHIYVAILLISQTNMDFINGQLFQKIS